VTKSVADEVLIPFEFCFFFVFLKSSGSGRPTTLENVKNDHNAISYYDKVSKAIIFRPLAPKNLLKILDLDDAISRR
jgi:hypothetical protein